MEFAESATTRSEASARGASKPSSRSLAAVELQLFSIAAELVPSAHGDGGSEREVSARVASGVLIYRKAVR